MDGYSSYAASVNSSGSHNQTGNSFLQTNKDAQAHVPAAYPDPHYTYHTPYANSTSAYVSPSYTSTDALPATAAAANAYLNNYAPQSASLPLPYPSDSTSSTYNQYHRPGSPTSWRNWAGNMASNFEPGADYMSSASALMQLGGRNEGPESRDLVVDGHPARGWPFMLIDGGTDSGQ